MSDSTRSGDDAGAVPDQAVPPRMPRWVKWPAIVLAVLVALFLALRLFGVEHGPGRHGPGGTAPASGTLTEYAPVGGHG